MRRFRCKKCNNIIRKLSYSIADKKLESGYTKPKIIRTYFYLCVDCDEVTEPLNFGGHYND